MGYRCTRNSKKGARTGRHQESPEADLVRMEGSEPGGRGLFGPTLLRVLDKAILDKEALDKETLDKETRGQGLG